MPVFTKDGSVSHDYFWWFHEGNRAVRVGDWKLVSAGKDAPWELYDLGTDRCEMKDVAAKQPAKVKEFEQVWKKHMAEFKELATKDLPAKYRENPPDKED